MHAPNYTWSRLIHCSWYHTNLSTNICLNPFPDGNLYLLEQCGDPNNWSKLCLCAYFFNLLLFFKTTYFLNLLLFFKICRFVTNRQLPQLTSDTTNWILLIITVRRGSIIQTHMLVMQVLLELRGQMSLHWTGLCQTRTRNTNPLLNMGNNYTLKN